MLYIKTKKLTKKSRTYAACRGFFLYSTVKHPDSDGNPVDVRAENKDLISFSTEKDRTYLITRV